MKPTSEPGVLVVGAGPVGLTAAAELARRGFACRIIDQNAAPATGSRAVTLHARTLEIFADMGVVNPVLEAGHRIHGANIFAEGRRILHFSFDELASPYPFALDLAQSETERVLTRHLRTLGVAVERGTSLTGLQQDEDGVTVYLTLPNAHIEAARASYVIGCDGAHSTIRHAAAMAFEGSPLEENYLLADVPLTGDAPEDEWHIWFHEDGLLSIFPMGGGIYRVIADIDAGTPAGAGVLATVLERRGSRCAEAGEPVGMSTFRVAHRTVLSYRQKRVFLAGDAAHVHSPAGGQGMNTGIHDAYNLAWKLAMVLRGNAPDALLDSYGAEREPVARSVLTLTENLTAVATLRGPVSQTIRNRLMPILAGFEVVEQRLVNRVAEISVNYRHSPIVGQSGRWHGAGPVPGDRAVDATLAGGRRLLDLLRRSPNHVVLLFASESPAAEDVRGFENIQRYMHEGYAGEMDTYVIARSALPWFQDAVLDPSGAAHHAYGAASACLYLIRPDGYVGFRSMGSDPLALLEYLNRVYEPPLEIPAPCRI